MKEQCALLAVLLVVVHSAYQPFEPNPVEYGIVQQAALRNNTHNLVSGWRQYGDRILYRGVIKESYKFLGTSTAEFKYPAWGYRSETITCVLAVDQYPKDTGGYVNITSGGVGLKQVSLSFKSQFSRGLQYVVEVYGM
ncbi:hypothetical protein L9F63_022960 [Diploptera punctata]|uniref:Salivary secreted peptide n=1 Tax=Diploptera punctata TaxID=6984 RepID=A0AAD7ZLG6_DIPPU|nr:hypothetical protein L9F63_022960 [Diploptera punctata]